MTAAEPWKDYSEEPAGPDLNAAVRKEWCTRNDGSISWGSARMRFSTNRRDALALLDYVQTMTNCSVFYEWDRECRLYRVRLQYCPWDRSDCFPFADQAWHAEAEAESLPLAICRAVMQTLDPDSEEGEAVALDRFLRNTAGLAGYTPR